MTQNDFYDLIRNRRSIRDFDIDRKVPDDTIIRILEAGRLAPTASNRQPVKFHLVQERKILKKGRVGQDPAPKVSVSVRHAVIL